VSGFSYTKPWLELTQVFCFLLEEAASSIKLQTLNFLQLPPKENKKISKRNALQKNTMSSNFINHLRGEPASSRTLYYFAECFTLFVNFRKGFPGWSAFYSIQKSNSICSPFDRKSFPELYEKMAVLKNIPDTLLANVLENVNRY
jgi:hypothetical protein